jgi:uncharacterized membrane-anchored protein
MPLTDHPLRMELNDEVHARPPQPLAVPSRLSYLALLCDADQRDAACGAVAALCRYFGTTPPANDAVHHTANLGPFRLQWERHTEFIRLKVIVDGSCDDPFGQPAIGVLPANWVASLPGQVMVAAHLALIKSEAEPADTDATAASWFAGNVPVGSAVSGGSVVALTDLRIHTDGFSRHVLLDHGASPRQAGRVAQRLLELETYRVMALLALPVARATAPLHAAAERELADITAAMVTIQQAGEPGLLERLTRLEAEIEHRAAATQFRFDAACAYYGLVLRRIGELREERLPGLQTIGEFIDRRLAPAMATCRSVAGRQDSLSRRVTRASRLLATRVDLARERQNQSLLESMNRRARVQLRLQATVESLSVAAVTYYCCGLVGHAAEALLTFGVQLRPEMATGISIPIVWLVAWLGLRHFRRSTLRREAD